MMIRAMISLAIYACLAATADAQQRDAAEFYAGKQIRLIVGTGPGGGYDIYARLLARHIGRHIPGSPNVVVVNMPGAASLTAIAANLEHVGARHTATLHRVDAFAFIVIKASRWVGITKPCGLPRAASPCCSMSTECSCARQSRNASLMRDA